IGDSEYKFGGIFGPPVATSEQFVISAGTELAIGVESDLADAPGNVDVTQFGYMALPASGPCAPSPPPPAVIPPPPCGAFKWVAPPKFQVQGAVTALHVWDPDGSGPQAPLLAVGGYFTTAGGAPAASIGLWDGSQWLLPGAGVNSPVRALTTYEGK